MNEWMSEKKALKTMKVIFIKVRVHKQQQQQESYITITAVAAAVSIILIHLTSSWVFFMFYLWYSS